MKFHPNLRRRVAGMAVCLSDSQRKRLEAGVEGLMGCVLWAGASPPFAHKTTWCLLLSPQFEEPDYRFAPEVVFISICALGNNSARSHMMSMFSLPSLQLLVVLISKYLDH